MPKWFQTYGSRKNVRTGDTAQEVKELTESLKYPDESEDHYTGLTVRLIATFMLMEDPSYDGKISPAW